MKIFSRKVVSNSFWMMFEKLIGIFGLIFVTSFVAKYIGPTNFGKIALATTIFTFVQTFTWFGNQEILFKRVSKNAKSGLQYLSSTQCIRKQLFILFTVPILGFFYFFSDHLTFIFGLATAFSVYFVTQDMHAIYNNALLNSHINAIANMLGLACALILRYIIVYFEMSIELLAIPIVLVSLIPYLLKKYWFNKTDRTKNILKSKYNKYYFTTGSALVISTLAISLYTQITSLFLAMLQSTFELGLYAAAIPLAMSWSFVNSAIITSVLSRVYQEKNLFMSYKMVAQLNSVIVAISLCIIIVLALLGEMLVSWLYGQAYAQSYPLILILGVATMFSGLGTIATRVMVKEESYAYIAKKMLVVALCSLPISYLMITYYGLKGAAYSVLVIELISATFFNYFYKKGLIFKIHFFPLFKDSLKLKV